ncbi:unnamed protein product, partial [Brassica rapa subsp. trilocularis]
MFSHGQSPHKRKCQQTNDENAKRQQRSKKTSSRSRMVLEDVTNIPHKKDNEFSLQNSPTKKNRQHRDVSSISLRMLKNRIRLSERIKTNSINKVGIDAQVSMTNQTQSVTFGSNYTITSEAQGSILNTNADVVTPPNRTLCCQRKITNIQDNDMTPNSVIDPPRCMHSIPLKSIFGRVLKDITNEPQSGGNGSHVVEKRYIPSPSFGALLHHPIGASTRRHREDIHSTAQRRNRFIQSKEFGILGTPEVLPSSRTEHLSSDKGKTNSQYQNTAINASKSNYDPAVIEPRRLFATHGINSLEDVVEGQYNQEYDLSSEESDEYSNLSTHAAYIFKDVEKFDFQAMLTRKKAQDAREAESKLKNISKTGLKMIAYVDEGNPTFICQYCDAKLWYSERLDRKTKTKKKPIFSLCCGQGQVKLPKLRESPLVIKQLLYGKDERSRYYQKNLRALNMLFSFTSLGGKVDRSIPNGVGPKTFTMQGENYHLMGSMKPDVGDSAKFSQLYIVDIETEVDDRDSVMSKYNTEADKSKKQAVRKQIIEDIIKVLDEVNPYVNQFRQARERLSMAPDEKFHMRIVSTREKDGRTYDTPTASEVAALIPGDFNLEMDRRDIVLQEKQTGWLKRISEIHPSYLALQDGEYQTLLHSRRLFQQFLVDAFTTIETNRLCFLKLNQKCLRSDSYDSIKQSENKGKVDMNDQGSRFVLPATFTGSPRYMKNNYLDAMAICRHFGFPDLFITFTCNPKWPEITRYLTQHNLNTEDRPEIISRVFKMKLDSLMTDLTDNEILGKTVASMYTVEFQKRGLPHAHILLFMHPSSKLSTTDHIDQTISA